MSNIGSRLNRRTLLGAAAATLAAPALPRLAPPSEVRARADPGPRALVGGACVAGVRPGGLRTPVDALWIAMSNE